MKASLGMMMKKKNFRQAAEKQLQEKPNVVSCERHDCPTTSKVQQIIHELAVHQIQLEMQNEELAKAEEIAHTLQEKYTNLFDSAPIAYLVWDHQSNIIECNLAGATMLGIPRKDVIRKRFTQFVTIKDRPYFSQFCEKSILNEPSQHCEVQLENEKHIYIETTQVAGLCRAAIIDITIRIHAEKLKKDIDNLFQVETTAELVKAGIILNTAKAQFYQQLAVQSKIDTNDPIVNSLIDQINMTNKIIINILQSKSD